jgi:hypothetical protein
MRRNVAALLLAAATVAVGLVWLARPADANDDTRWDVIGGVIAHRGDGWHIHKQGHSNKHLLSVRCRGRYLEVKHTPGVDVPIWQGPDVDEHLRRWDITAAVSATHDEARIFFDIDGEPITCWHRAFREPLSNVWMGGDIELPA